MATSDNTLHLSTSIKNQKTKILPHQCLICRAPAEYSYYGAISCQSCKVFFKRNAHREQKVFTCDFDDECHININNRHICKSCRLAKCFRSGMNADRFRGPNHIKSETSTLAKVHTQHELARLPTLDLLEADRSLLTINQWTLLSNLFNCYEESPILPFTQRLIDAHNSSQSTYPIYKTLADEFLVSIYQAAGAYLCYNADIRHLPIYDRSIILRSAADNVTCMGGTFIVKNSHLCALDGFFTTMNTKYGNQIMDIYTKARKYVDPDIIIIKLAIALFAFSENTCCYYSRRTSNNLTNPIHIMNIQNKYAELTWKYLLYGYGYDHAIKRFLNLVLWFTSMNTLAVHAQTLAGHLNDIDSIIEQTEIKLAVDDIEEII